MKKWGMFFGWIFLLSGSVAHADSMQFFGQLDYWLKGNADKSYEDDTRNALGALVNVVGYDSANASIKTTNGIGVRAGVMSPTHSSGWRMGGSLGYVEGPRIETTLNAISAVSGNGQATEKVKTSFVRALVEFQNTIPMQDSFGFKLRGGLGIAQGRIKTDQTFSGTLVSIVGFPSSYSASDDWTGFTWEISPGFVISGESFDFNFGLMYSGFPKLKESDDFSKFDWSALGLQLTLAFKPPRQTSSKARIEKAPEQLVQPVSTQTDPAKTENVSPQPEQTMPMKEETEIWKQP